MVHATLLLRNVADRTYEATCADVPLVFDPTEAVLGEPAVELQNASKHRLTVQLTEGATQCIDKFLDKKFKLLSLPKAAAAPAPEEPSEPSKPDSILTFSDRSFVKTTLRKNLDQFMLVLANSYTQAAPKWVGEGLGHARAVRVLWFACYVISGRRCIHQRQRRGDIAEWDGGKLQRSEQAHIHFFREGVRGP